jgi:RNA recognition motif-containing protein
MKLEDLVPTLHALFSEYGKILDIVAKRSIKRRGQAFVVFDNVDSATRALEDVQGFELFRKPMVVEFARTRSDALVKMTGDEGEFERHKRSRLAEKGMSRSLIWCFVVNKESLTVSIFLQSGNKHSRHTRSRRT